jgi:hypothetical protein
MSTLNLSQSAHATAKTLARHAIQTGNAATLERALTRLSADELNAEDDHPLLLLEAVTQDAPQLVDLLLAKGASPLLGKLHNALTLALLQPHRPNPNIVRSLSGALTTIEDINTLGYLFWEAMGRMRHHNPEICRIIDARIVAFSAPGSPPERQVIGQQWAEKAFAGSLSASAVGIVEPLRSTREIGEHPEIASVCVHLDRHFRDLPPGTRNKQTWLPQGASAMDSSEFGRALLGGTAMLEWRNHAEYDDERYTPVSTVRLSWSESKDAMARFVASRAPLDKTGTLFCGLVESERSFVDASMPQLEAILSEGADPLLLGLGPVSAFQDIAQNSGLGVAIGCVDLAEKMGLLSVQGGGRQSFLYSICDSRDIARDLERMPARREQFANLIFRLVATGQSLLTPGRFFGNPLTSLAQLYGPAAFMKAIQSCKPDEVARFKGNREGGLIFYYADDQEHGEPRVEDIEQLVAMGASLDDRDSDGNTALHKTVAQGYATKASALILAGADLEATNHAGQRPDEVTDSNPWKTEQCDQCCDIIRAARISRDLKARISVARTPPAALGT